VFNIIVDEEINLTLADPKYATKMFQLIDDDRDYLSQWMSWPKLTTKVSDCEASAKRMLHDYADGKCLPCYIIYKGSLVGTASFNVIDRSLKRVEIGYWLSATYQGRGIVTRVCQQLITVARNDLDIQKIQISVAEENAPSRAVCERLEFDLEGMIKHAENINGRIVTHAIYGKILE